MSRTPRRTNSRSRATAKVVAGASLGGVWFIVEVGEFLLETADALRLLLLRGEGPKERRIVVGRDHPTLATPVAPPVAADREPQQGTHDRHEHDDENPGELGKGAHARAVDDDDVDDREHVEHERDDAEHEQATHQAILGGRIPPILGAYTGRVRPWLAYTLLRLGLFAVLFATLMLLGVEWWLSALFAAVIGLCIAYIFFGRLRDQVAREVAQRRARPATDVDATAEDDELPEER